jgi:uncharacterized membrane protein YebE (DUF533 family)
MTESDHPPSEPWKKDVFVALAAIAWADGSLDPDEADAIVRAACDAGLDLDDIAEVEEATRERRDLGKLDQATLSKDDRLFIYAIACWIARLDGKVTDAEGWALSALGERLGVPERMRAIAERLASDVAALPEGDRPARYDLTTLRQMLATARRVKPG